MLYILPPPSAPNPPSPWNSILCANNNNSSNNNPSSPSVNFITSGNNSTNTVTTSSATDNSRTSWKTERFVKRPPFRTKFSSSLNGKLRSVVNDSGNGIPADDEDTARGGRSLSECYFAGKGAALVLPPHERLRPSRRVSVAGSDIQQHLQSMFYLLRPEETLKMAVKLESAHAGRTRYLVVVSCLGRQDAEESCLLGIDCNERTTVGLVLRVLADTAITLDGDGGFSVNVCGRQHIFKPVSVQAMWSALQTLHKVSSKAREQNYFLGGLTHDWVNYYEQRIESDRSCLNEWHAMDSIESRRPPSPDSLRTKPRERDETEKVIRAALKEIMMSVDLDEVTSKYIRSRLEEHLDMDLGEFKSFIDQEMLTILGQMDAPTEIFEHVYLGSEWNASNLEELQKNGVRHILNVTREIDNFFPGMFDYLNIRVYDDEKTDLLKHWDNTFKYITRAQKEGSKVLVHCKMGVSRSASVVIAYAMKAYNWDFNQALQHVKEKRNCIKPNTSFLTQLETYQGILDAMKNKEKLQRSKSETNLKSPGLVAKNDRILAGSEPTPMVQAFARSNALQTAMSGQDLRQIGGRPKSWSPDNRVASNLLQCPTGPTSVSLEQLSKEPTSKVTFTNTEKTSRNVNSNASPTSEVENRNVLMPCENGQAYSVSQNQIVHLPRMNQQQTELSDTVPSVKHRVIELETVAKSNTKNHVDKKGLSLNLNAQFDNVSPKQGSPDNSLEGEKTPRNIVDDPNSKLAPQMLTAVLVKKEIWDPGEKEMTTVSYSDINKTCDLTAPVQNNDSSLVYTTSTRLVEKTNLVKDDIVNCMNGSNIASDTQSDTVKTQTNVGTRTLPLIKKDGDPFSNQLDRVFDREERKQQRQSTIAPSSVPPLLHQCITELSSEESVRESPSRQSSWSSYDSAVVLNYQGELRDVPSRHSSWGSGDTRTLPSRNSSWGSYDMRPCAAPISEQNNSTAQEKFVGSGGLFAYDKEEIPWYPGTVKRTKQKLEENSGVVKRVCSENKSVDDGKNVRRSSDLNSELNFNVNNFCPYHSSGSETVPQAQSVTETYNTALLNNSNSFCNCGVKTEAMNFSNSSETLISNSSEQITSTKEININNVNASASNSNHLFFPNGSRLSVSAPETSSLNQILSEKCVKNSNSANNITSLLNQSTKHFCNSNFNPAILTNSSVKQHKLYLENLSKANILAKRCSSVDESATTEYENNKNTSGIVKSLKKEFEAKTGIKNDKCVDEQSKTKVRSLPSSPVSTHVELKPVLEINPAPDIIDPLEDLSVKKLVGKYEINSIDSKTAPSDTHMSSKVDSKSQRLSQHFNLNSNKNTFIEIPKCTPPISKSLVSNLKIGETEFKRPPVPPTVVKSTMPSVLASVITNAANKKQQQHGRTHPLTRLTINKRHNNPVYNTM